MLNKRDRKYLRDRIEISKESIENKLSKWKKIGESYKKEKPVLETSRWGNRIIGHIQSLEFCLKEVSRILNIEMLKI